MKKLFLLILLVLTPSCSSLIPSTTFGKVAAGGSVVMVATGLHPVHALSCFLILETGRLLCRDINACQEAIVERDTLLSLYDDSLLERGGIDPKDMWTLE